MNLHALVLLVLVVLGHSFCRTTTNPTFLLWPRSQVLVSRSAASDDNEIPAKNNKKGYQFGDITKSLFNKASSKVNNLTGKSKYEFGDLSRWLDQQAKDQINNLTGQEDYVFGDLTRYVDHQIKLQVGNYTGKTDYQVGDISKEVVRRVWAGEYELGDVLLCLRILVSAGVSLTPLASALPVKVLLELVNLGLAQEVGGRITGELGKAVDEKFKLALTGDSQYQLGDVSKKELVKSIQAFTGKQEYSFGDVSQKLAQIMSSSSSSQRELKLSKEATKSLALWDERFQKKTGQR